VTAREVGDGEARAERLATSLTNRLVREGVILDHRWRDALHAQPRHHFVDAFHEPGEPGEPGGSWRETATDAATFLPTIHSGRTVVTALSPLDPWGRQVPVSIAPPVDLLITGLQALDLFDGADVLELGTGTGHTTALLSERLGDGHVTSVDIDPDLHHTAARHLHARDLHPTLLVGDSASPSARTEYDRVIVEHEVPTVPPSWVALVRPGGSLLVRVTGGLSAGGHVLLRRPDSGEPVLSGRFLAWGGPLAPHRAPARRLFVRRPPEPVADGARPCSSPFSPSALTDGGALALLMQLMLPPGVQAQRRASGDTTWATYLRGADGSWAEISHELGRTGLYDVRWAGNLRLLSAVEHAHDLWHRLGTPPLTAFGITAGTDGARVWHDSADAGTWWPLRAA